MRLVVRVILVTSCVPMIFGLRSYSQTNAPNESPSVSPPAPSAAVSANQDSGRVGIGVKASTLGGGAEVAFRVTDRSNVRTGFNMISYSRGFSKDGIAYNGQLSFKTVEAHFDFFPFAGSFHISPGVLAYIGDPITGTPSVPGGRSFTLGGKAFFSDTTTPVAGSGKINFNRAAPTVTVGWGNLVPRSGKRFSIPFEVGIAFQGSPQTTLNLTGNVCDSPGVNCRPVASDSVVQSQIHTEQTKINNSLSLFKIYPIISIGVGFKF
jgi:hypothetical protein